jgi:hypothetical protein
MKNVTELNHLELNAFITDLVEQKDTAYKERNMVLLLCMRLAEARGIKVGRWFHEGEDDGWGWIVSICLHTGWCDWHIHDSELHLFEEFPVIQREWEDYPTEEKYRERVLPAKFANFSQLITSAISEL